jgi:hypothetical protein
MSEEQKKDTRWKPGQSGNAAGRPKGAAGWKRRLEEMASEPHPSDANGRTHLERMFGLILQTATKAGRPSILKLRAQELVLGYVIGKPVQAVANFDMNPESKKQLIENLLSVLQADKEEKPDGKLPVQ